MEFIILVTLCLQKTLDPPLPNYFLPFWPAAMHLIWCQFGNYPGDELLSERVPEIHPFAGRKWLLVAFPGGKLFSGCLRPLKMS